MNVSFQNSRHSMKSLLNEYKANLGQNDPIVIDPHVANIVKAVSALTGKSFILHFIILLHQNILIISAAFRLVQLDRCKGQKDAGCLRELHADKLHEAILGKIFLHSHS